MQKRRLVTGIANAAAANFLGLSVGILVGFFLPRHLTLGEYAMYQTFNFYGFYLVALQFGIATGLHLKYGGMKESDIDRRGLASELALLLLVLLACTVLGLAAGLALSDPMLMAVALFALPFNVIQCYKLLYQATNELRKYSVLQTSESILTALAAAAFLLLHRHDTMSLIWWRIVLAGLMALVLLKGWFRYLPSIRQLQPFSAANIRVARTGFQVMLGGFAVLFLHTTDRWFVKVFLTDTDFALYSFAIAMYGVLATLLYSISMTFYPAFAAVGIADASVEKLRKIMLVAGALLCASFFAFKFVVLHFLGKYAPSLTIISYLFLAVPALSVVDTIYLNLYRARKQTSRYLAVSAVVLVLSVLLNVGAIAVSRSRLSICIANTIAFYIWFLYCSRDFGGPRALLPDLAFLALFSGGFIYTSQFVPSLWLGLGLFLLSVGAVSLALYRPLFADSLGRWRLSGRRGGAAESPAVSL